MIPVVDPGTVVGGENYERVLIETVAAERLQDLADTPVDAIIPRELLLPEPDPELRRQQRDRIDQLFERAPIARRIAEAQIVSGTPVKGLPKRLGLSEREVANGRMQISRLRKKVGGQKAKPPRAKRAPASQADWNWLLPRRGFRVEQVGNHRVFVPTMTDDPTDN